MHFTNAVRDTPLWWSAMAQVRRRYADAFDAATSSEPDTFVVAYEPAPAGGPDGTVLACVGLSFGTGRPFFCERYLADSAEEVLRGHLERDTARDEIVEVGPLASEEAGAGAEIISILPVFVWGLGRRYGLMTVTTPLRAMLDRMGYPFEPITAASRDALSPAERDRWGSYYRQAPQTGLIQLDRMAPLLIRSAGRYLSTHLTFRRIDDDKERTLALA